MVENIRVGEKLFLLKIETDEKISAKPGQFVLIKTSTSWSKDPLLRRPFAVFDLEKKSISILFKVVGRGTHFMAMLRKGERVEFSGPFGNSFPFPKDKAIFIAGGSGIASLNLLGKEIYKKKKIKLYYGVKSSKDMVPLSILSFKPSDFLLATEDGSKEKRGVITDFIKPEDGTYYLAGPSPMVKEFSKNFKADAFASMEERMACGIGVCMGCGILTKDKGYKRVCVDGPVFSLSEIQWED